MATKHRGRRSPARWRPWKGFEGKNGVGVELVGDWSRCVAPPSFARGATYEIRIGGEFLGGNLDCLRLMPMARKLSILNYRIRDFSGIHVLKNLEELWFNQRFPQSRLNLDFSNLPNLRRMRVEWDGTVSNQSELKKLRYLKITGCSGVKHLDLSGLCSLQELDIGPAQGVERVSLHGIPRLKRLTLSLMGNLRFLEGDLIYDTVTDLGISGTRHIPRSVLACFRRLKSVDVGSRGVFSRADFPACRPELYRLPV